MFRSRAPESSSNVHNSLLGTDELQCIRVSDCSGQQDKFNAYAMLEEQSWGLGILKSSRLPTFQQYVFINFYTSAIHPH